MDDVRIVAHKRLFVRYTHDLIKEHRHHSLPFTHWGRWHIYVPMKYVIIISDNSLFSGLQNQRKNSWKFES